MKRWKPRYVALNGTSIRVYPSREDFDLVRWAALQRSAAVRAAAKHLPRLLDSLRCVVLVCVQGRPPLGTVILQPNMGLSDLKVNTSKKTRTVYRHLYELRAGAALGSSSASKAKHRVWKFGSDNQSEFEKWCKAIRANVDRLSEVRALTRAVAVCFLFAPCLRDRLCRCCRHLLSHVPDRTAALHALPCSWLASESVKPCPWKPWSRRVMCWLRP
jgi:hypothetical protein